MSDQTKTTGTTKQKAQTKDYITQLKKTETTKETKINEADDIDWEKN